MILWGFVTSVKGLDCISCLHNVNSTLQAFFLQSIWSYNNMALYKLVYYYYYYYYYCLLYTSDAADE